MELQSDSSKTNGKVLSRGKKIRYHERKEHFCKDRVHKDIIFLLTFHLLMSHYLPDIAQLRS